jgi:hypothetical protein
MQIRFFVASLVGGLMAVLAIDQILPAVGFTVYAIIGICVGIATTLIALRIFQREMEVFAGGAPDLRGMILAVLIVALGTLILAMGVLAGMVWPATLVTAGILSGGGNDRGPSRPMLA